MTDVSSRHAVVTAPTHEGDGQAELTAVTGTCFSISPSYLSRLSLLPSLGREMSTGQSAVMLCGWGVKAGWFISRVVLGRLSSSEIRDPTLGCRMPSGDNVTGLWVTRQLADTPTRGLPTRVLDDSRTGHLADATGDFACLVFVFGHLLMFSWVCT